MKIREFFFLPVLLLITACGGPSGEDKILKEAVDIHNEAVKIIKDLGPALDSLTQISNSINVQGRALSPKEVLFTNRVTGLQRRLAYWEENHVEVPGNDHHDHSGHNHDHDHNHGANNFNFTAADMLIIQQEYRDSIKAIKTRLEFLLNSVPKE